MLAKGDFPVRTVRARKRPCYFNGRNLIKLTMDSRI